jgi:hypothetical protein
VRPTYVLDYPVSSTPEGYEFIRDLHRSGACEIGAHLHPWDSPPLVEQVTDENSYPGNLPFELEREKLIRLTHSIEENVGVRPRIYKAGRYGVGRATARILAELGYEIDASVVPGTDLTGQLGPDFSHCRASPYWFGRDPALLEIPLSIGYTGLFAESGTVAYRLTMNERLKALHVPGILARLGLVERITLTPEGISFDEQRRLTRALLRKGHRVFSFAYHSPSLAPGNTPYVRSAADLGAFLRRIAAGQQHPSRSRRSRSNRACWNAARPNALPNPLADLEGSKRPFRGGGIVSQGVAQERRGFRALRPVWPLSSGCHRGQLEDWILAQRRHGFHG